jgi:hypothetical protein
VGLDQLVSESYRDRVMLTRAVPSRPWPGGASLEVAHVYGRSIRGQSPAETWRGPFHIDDANVVGVTSFLTPPGRITGKPHRLQANSGMSFQGSNMLGLGFVMAPEQAKALIARNRRNANVLLPYLTGENLNTRPDQSPSRWVIYFRDWPLQREALKTPGGGAASWMLADEKQRRLWLRTGVVPQDYTDPVAADYPDCLRIVEERVKPERMQQADEGAKRLWWRFLRPGLELQLAIERLQRVLVIAQTSKTQSPVIVPKCVYSHKLIVFASDDTALCGLLASSLHYNWTIEYSGSMKTDPVYAPTDCFETFSFPTNGVTGIRASAEEFLNARSSVMEQAGTGLTPAISQINDPADRDRVVQVARLAYEGLDRVVVAAYGWDDLTEKLNHGFHANKWGIRFTVGPDARAEILARLLALNHERYAEEVTAGLHGKGKPKGKMAGRKAGMVGRAAVLFKDGE